MIDEPYLFERKFIISDIVAEHKDKMLAKFIDDKIDNERGKGYNTDYGDKNFDREIAKRFIRAIDDNFIVDRDRIVEHDGYFGTLVNGNFQPIRSWLYCQNNVHNNSVAHTHINTSSINAVTYIDVPNDGGALELDIMGEKTYLKPTDDRIYFFPYWVVHRPLPQTDEKWRLCINLEFFDEKRPVRKKDEYGKPEIRW